jgi:transcriptional regulator with XRE-family HTH domain
VIFVQNAEKGEIGKRIFQFLEENRISQVELANATGIPIGTISDWNRKGTNPSSDKISCICEFFKVSAEWLLTGKELEYNASHIGNISGSAFVQGINRGTVTMGSEKKEFSKEALELAEIHDLLDLERRHRLIGLALELKKEIENK